MRKRDWLERKLFTLITTALKPLFSRTNQNAAPTSSQTHYGVPPDAQSQQRHTADFPSNSGDDPSAGGASNLLKLESLPDDVLVEILKKLPPSHVLSKVSLVSRKFKNLIDIRPETYLSDRIPRHLEWFMGKITLETSPTVLQSVTDHENDRSMPRQVTKRAARSAVVRARNHTLTDQVLAKQADPKEAISDPRELSFLIQDIAHYGNNSHRNQLIENYLFRIDPLSQNIALMFLATYGDQSYKDYASKIDAIIHPPGKRNVRQNNPNEQRLYDHILWYLPWGKEDQYTFDGNALSISLDPSHPNQCLVHKKETPRSIQEEGKHERLQDQIVELPPDLQKIAAALPGRGSTGRETDRDNNLFYAAVALPMTAYGYDLKSSFPVAKSGDAWHPILKDKTVGKDQLPLTAQEGAAAEHIRLAYETHFIKKFARLPVIPNDKYRAIDACFKELNTTPATFQNVSRILDPSRSTPRSSRDLGTGR